MKRILMAITMIIIFAALTASGCRNGAKPQTSLPADSPMKTMKISAAKTLADEIVQIIHEGDFESAQRKIDLSSTERLITPDGRTILSLLYDDISKNQSITESVDQWCTGSQATHSAYIIRLYHQRNFANQ